MEYFKKVSITAISVLLISCFYGQDYHKLIRSECDWDIHHALGSEICMLSGGGRYFFDGDSSISGINYRVVKVHPIINIVPGPYCPPFAIDTTIVFDAYLMREDTLSRKVFIYDYSNNTEDLLYDFTLQAGDTLNSMFAGQGTYIVIDSVGFTKLLNGDTMRIWYLNSEEFYIESIGGSQGLCFPLVQGIGFWNIPLCITDNDEHLWGNECFGLVGIEEHNLGMQLTNYPNPFTTSTTIEYELTEPSTVHITIYNAMGEAILLTDEGTLPTGKHAFTWTPERLSEGLYYAVMRSGDGVSVIKLLKQ
jgi:hypothetical protein